MYGKKRRNGGVIFRPTSFRTCSMEQSAACIPSNRKIPRRPKTTSLPFEDARNVISMHFRRDALTTIWPLATIQGNFLFLGRGNLFSTSVLAALNISRELKHDRHRPAYFSSLKPGPSKDVMFRRHTTLPRNSYSASARKFLGFASFNTSRVVNVSRLTQWHLVLVSPRIQVVLTTQPREPK